MAYNLMNGGTVLVVIAGTGGGGPGMSSGSEKTVGMTARMPNGGERALI